MAIAFDAITQGTSASATTHTIAHTVTGTNPVLLVGFQSGATDDVSSVTYNGVAMTRIGAVLNAGGNSSFLYGLNAPATGANNVVITFSSAETVSPYFFWSYNGAAGGIRNSATNTADPATGLTLTLTPDTDHCWVASFFGTPGQTAGTMSTGTSRNTLATYKGVCGDNNADISPAASTNLVGAGNNNAWAGIIVALARDAAAAGPANLKSLDGNLKANMKSYNGNLLANIKSIDGNS